MAQHLKTFLKPLKTPAKRFTLFFRILAIKFEARYMWPRYIAKRQSYFNR